MDDQERAQIGERVRAARKRYGWVKERVCSDLGLTAPTWNKIEAGLPVRDDKLAVVLRFVETAEGRGGQSLAEFSDAELLAELERRLREARDEAAVAISARQDDDGKIRVSARRQTKPKQ